MKWFMRKLIWRMKSRLRRLFKIGFIYGGKAQYNPDITGAIDYRN